VFSITIHRIRVGRITARRRVKDVEVGITSMPSRAGATPPSRSRAAALNLDDLLLFVTAATAALPAAVAVAIAEARAAVEPAAVAEAAAERPFFAAPGSQARFAQLLENYDRLIRGIVGRVGRRLGLNRDNFLTREDIEQEVRLDLWKQVARGQQIDFPATYIYKATIRETLRALRRTVSRETVSLDSSGVADRLLDSVDPFHSLAAKEQFREIIFGIRCLAPDRQCAVRAHLTGFGFNEIMHLYGWSYQRTRNLISRGMADLRKSLNDNGEAPEEAHQMARHTLSAVVRLAQIPRRLAAAQSRG
jgi:DNA-directed RNA polymerase specialized sigma24 family protein